LNPTILFRNHESWGCLLRGFTWFENTKFDHVIEFFFESLPMDVRYSVSMVVHRLSSQFEVNENLLMRVDYKEANKYFFAF